MAEQEKYGKNTIIITIFGFLLLVAVLTSVYFFNKYQESKKSVNTQVSASRELDQVIKAVGKLMELPKGETPTLATVSDKSKLANQDFFKNSENGDKVLIYEQAKKAILYRPSTNKIIEVAPVNLATATPTASKVSPTPTSAATQSAKVKIGLFNGTSKVGVTYNAEKTLKTKFSNIEVVVKETADNEDYQNTIVADLTGKNKQFAQELAKAVGGQVSTVNKSGLEIKDSEVVVIFGQDYIE